MCPIWRLIKQYLRSNVYLLYINVVVNYKDIVNFHIATFKSIPYKFQKIYICLLSMPNKRFNIRAVRLSKSGFGIWILDIL